MVLWPVQGGACYAEVQQLWQHAQQAEQAEADARATLQIVKDQQAQAALTLKVCSVLPVLL